MRVDIKIEAKLEVSESAYEALKGASVLELVRTAQMQGAKLSVSVKKAQRT